MKTLKEDFFDNLGIGERYLVDKFCDDFGISKKYVSDKTLEITNAKFEFSFSKNLLFNKENYNNIPKGDVIRIKNFYAGILFFNLDFKKYKFENIFKGKFQHMCFHNCTNISEFFIQNPKIKQIYTLSIDGVKSNIDFSIIPETVEFEVLNPDIVKDMFKETSINVKDKLILSKYWFTPIYYNKESKNFYYKNQQYFEKLKKWVKKVNIPELKIKHGTALYCDLNKFIELESDE